MKKQTDKQTNTRTDGRTDATKYIISLASRSIIKHMAINLDKTHKGISFFHLAFRKYIVFKELPIAINYSMGGGGERLGRWRGNCLYLLKV